MNLKQYIEHLQKIEKKYGGELECIYAIDDEGNAHNTVDFTPGVGHFDAPEFATYPEKENFENINNYKIELDNFNEEFEINAVCVN